ncbi:MAG: acetyltransferase [Bacilli bacterium]
MKKLVIIGAGGFGREVQLIIQRINEVKKTYDLIGFIDDRIELNSKVNESIILGDIDSLINYNESLNVVIAIGNSENRIKTYNKLKSLKEFEYPNIIDPSSQINESRLGKGNIICANSFFTVNYELIDFVIVNLACTVGHDCMLDSFVTVYPGVNISGNVNIGAGTEIGTGTKIIQGINIGSDTIVGAGSVVIRDLPSRVTAVGSPAKVIKERK